MTRALALLAAVALLASACGPATGPVRPPALETLTETWGCGHGFWIGNPQQTAALRFQSLAADGVPVDAELPSGEWEAVVLEGVDLYANWCDDVIEPGEPQPEIVATLEVVRGTLDVIGEPPAEPFAGTNLMLQATGLAVQMPSGEVIPLGDVTVVNPTYGLFAG